MVLVTESRHRCSLNFANERKVVTLRDQGWTWEDIAGEVKNLEGDNPSEWLARKVYNTFSRKAGRCKYNYDKCGRKPWKVTPKVRTFIVNKLMQLRKRHIVTSTTLQGSGAKKFKIQLDASYIRKILVNAGYKWLPRAQKKKYTPDQMKARLRFAKFVCSLSKKALRERLSFSMDGVVLAAPPRNDIDRANHCWGGATHMWRKPSEGATPELAGENPYVKQCPISRAIPLWGGISEGGYSRLSP